MYKVFFVLGGESSGTRITTKFLINGGVLGSAEHAQPYDISIRGAKTPFVWRRSFPHDKRMPDVALEMLHPLVEEGIIDSPDDLLVLVTVRNWLAAEYSAVDQNHSYDRAEANYRNREGYKAIFRFLQFHEYPFEIVPLEAFLYAKVFYVPYLYEKCGLAVPYEIQKEFMNSLKDVNEKHFWRYLNVKREKEVRYKTETNEAGRFSTEADKR